MTDTPKILGQLLPVTTANQILYQVPATGVLGTIVSTISMCNIINQNVGTIASANVWMVPSTSLGTSSNTNALYSGLTINASDTFLATGGFTMSPSDAIIVKS